MGNFEIELYPDQAPVTGANFQRYVEEGFYNGLTFHRVIAGFVIQGGAYTPDMVLKPPHAPIIIGAVRTGTKNGINDVPVLPVVIIRARYPWRWGGQ